jgi:LysM repeat protein
MDAPHGISEEVSLMSTIAAPHDFSFSREGSPRRTSSVRLTRRGRLTVLALFLGLAFVALTVFGDTSAATGEAGQPVETRTIVVAPGDTLWGIASEIAEPGEVREMIHYIQELNALPSAGLMQGQELAVPVD